MFFSALVASGLQQPLKEKLAFEAVKLALAANKGSAMVICTHWRLIGEPKMTCACSSASINLSVCSPRGCQGSAGQSVLPFLQLHPIVQYAVRLLVVILPVIPNIPPLLRQQ